MSTIDAVLQPDVPSDIAPGVVAMAADRDGIIYQGAFGQRDLDSGAPMTLDTIFRIASMTKAVTSVAAMQFVERGQLQLDTPAADILPELARARVLTGFDADGQPTYRPPARPPTLRHLLTHTAGYAYQFWNGDIVRLVLLGLLPTFSPTDDSLLEAPMVRDPGERWEYSIATDWVGKIVEALHGRQLGDYFQTHIFDPLGMVDSAFTLRSDQLDRLSTPYQRAPSGKPIAAPLPLPVEPFHHSGGGGLFSTAADYLRFTRALLGGGTLDGVTLLLPQTIDLMAQNQIGDLVVREMPAHVPEASNDFLFAPHSTNKFGLGFQINTEPLAAGRSTGSLAWGGIYNTYYWIDRSRGVTGVFCVQLRPFFDDRCVAYFTRFERAVYDSLD